MINSNNKEKKCFVCSNCGIELDDEDLEKNDYICPRCKNDFWMTKILKVKNQ